MSNIEKYTVPEGQYAEGKSLGDLHVNMSNQLVRSSHGLNLVEKRIISACVAMIDNMRIAEHADFSQMLVRLNANEYGHHYGIDMKNAYRELQTASERLFERYIVMHKETPRGPKEHRFRWVSGIQYHHGEGWIELNFTREVMPYISLLRDNYTSYQLNKVSAIRSVYSWRLLELLKSWQSTKELFISLEDFRHALEIPASYVYADIRVKCIEPAIKELKNKNGLLITWKPVKKGRAVASLRFKWKEDNQIKLELEGGGANPKPRRRKKPTT